MHYKRVKLLCKLFTEKHIGQHIKRARNQGEKQQHKRIFTVHFNTQKRRGYINPEKQRCSIVQVTQNFNKQYLSPFVKHKSEICLFKGFGAAARYRHCLARFCNNFGAGKSVNIRQKNYIAAVAFEKTVSLGKTVFKGVQRLVNLIGLAAF